MVWAEVFESIEKHLATNEIDFDAEPLKVGPWLTVDGTTDEIIESGGVSTVGELKEAKKLARGVYRVPYVMPVEV